MRTLTPTVFVLLTACVLPVAARAGDAEGCADLKLFPRLEGCAIVECSAKQHDTFDSGDASGSPLEANTNSLVYACPAGDLQHGAGDLQRPVWDVQKMKRDFEAQLRKAGYLGVTENNGDPASPRISGRKGSQWIQWSANSEDNVVSYALTAATGSGEKFNAEACAPLAALSALKQCGVVECASKAEDSVAMRIAQKEETALTGNVQTLTLACPSIRAAQTFSAVEGELRASGYEILFSDREHPESAWLTGREGKRWVELVSAPDGESVSYALTVVPSAETLTAAKAEPLLAAVATPAPAAVPKPEPASATAPSVKGGTATAPKPEPTPEPSINAAQATVQTATVVVPRPTATASEEAAPQGPLPGGASPPVTAPVTTAGTPSHPGFIPPKPILEVQIEPTHDRMYSVMGDIVITLLVDVSPDGTVTNAVLGGHITQDVRKLESAALEAVSHWRFEPARQDGRAVAATRIPVQMHFHGRPWRF